MNLLVLEIARVRTELPRETLQWALDTATPTFRSWTELLSRSDVSDAQAWALLWRDGKLERSAEKQPRESERYWSSNASSERLAEHVASYLARPDVPPGAVGRIRERFDTETVTRLDLLRSVVRLGGSDIVCHELAAEPPAGSSRGPQLGSRERALVERYRNTCQRETEERDRTIVADVEAILGEPDLVRRVKCAQSRNAFGLRVLEACVFGHGSVAPRPEDADAESAEWLENASGSVMTYSDDSHKLGPVLSALRPIVRLHRDLTDPLTQRWWSRRVRDFGPAGTVPLTYSIPSEEGAYVVRRLGNDIPSYQKLMELVAQRRDSTLAELCTAACRR
ncbi:hypothetical protein [Rhodococcus opacus]|uniref:hypothetical protein n=1 Tax=Rhodococcus opacus TaxID=37919 RepID=UPI001F567577|nr:hypothetical protein [Rhodococcus opacus]UNN05287.1 hypothetical protein MOO23_40935 [Rhodococcus opacus]